MSTSINHHASLSFHNKKVEGCFSEIDGELFYCVRNFQRMKPFLMSIVSSSDLWMYISSNGGLTAGRQHCNNALFPYVTDDLLHEAHPTTGSRTIVWIQNEDRVHVWEPFSSCSRGIYELERNLYKNTPGNKVIFEEINHTLRLRFCYAWMNSDLLGWVRKSTLENLSGESLEANVCDGLQNVLPWGIERKTQSMMSTLMDAYKVCEYIPKEHLALFYMSSIPIDRAEPCEALKTNTIWSFGLSFDNILLGNEQLDQFRQEGAVASEQKIFGEKTNYLLTARIDLQPGGRREWYLMADVAKDASDVVAMRKLIAQVTSAGHKVIDQNIEQDACKLVDMVARADGLQQTGDRLNDSRHLSNTLFNIMRGGVFPPDCKVPVKNFLTHLRNNNVRLWEKYSKEHFASDSSIEVEELHRYARSSGDKDFIRLALEYLPLSFSRRHGDPSRPWNHFDIRIKNPDGSPLLSYQGNWRDIFQNWEALGFSFPAFLPGMVARFLNASTADGYNPYRITSEGFDWEVPEPDNPWASIGFWGDHQINYLLRLMEMQEKFFPGSLSSFFNEKLFVYARVPYRIRSYAEIFKDPQNTIIFDDDLHRSLIDRSRKEGNDAKLVRQQNGQIQRAGFMEKMLVSLLTKLSNYVPEAGIWMNTQRPEWNDANNALAGYGASMVSLFYIRRFADFLTTLIQRSDCLEFSIASEVFDFNKAIWNVFRDAMPFISRGFSGEERKTTMDLLGKAGEQYRDAAYDGFSGEDRVLKKENLVEFLQLVMMHLDHAIETNRRKDGLYHSYNLIDLKDNAVEINHLFLMLEGQVAILGSGCLSPQQTAHLVDSLFDSQLWREDQRSFMLYPFQEQPGFLHKNLIPHNLIQKSKLLRHLLEMNNSDIVQKDAQGDCHFNAALKNANYLKIALENLAEKAGSELVLKETPLVLEIYEQVFRHRFFPGRSGSFYKYEGLGSIYWHMVSKLLLALGERIIDFTIETPGSRHLPALKASYYRIREGIGTHKQPDEYGAFPTDPYSHTPLMMGAQQPGMTGQVKEDFLSRFNELGLIIREGKIHFIPVLLKEEELLQEKAVTFSFCGTKVVYQLNQQGEFEMLFGSDHGDPVPLSRLVESPDMLSDLFHRRL